MSAVKVRCSNLDCGKCYLLKDSSLVETRVCRKCGSLLALFFDKGSLDQIAVATAAPRGDTAEIPAVCIDSSPDAVSTVPKHELDTVGRFRILGRLGQGAFGVVYRAHDPLLDRELAIKVPNGTSQSKPAAVARFLREPKAAAQLRHPYIVPIYDAGVEEGRYYIASAFIEGDTLEAVLQDRSIDFRQSAKIVLQLAEALDYAHGLGVVHRDIKPSNIMIDTRGDALLMDFGLARISATEELTHDGTVLGTPSYMAPEQASGRKDDVGPASDQYSLGVVLYELLCGRRPFSGPPAVVLYNAINEPPPPPCKVRPEVPIDLETVVLKAMAKQPAERYPCCQELAADLRRWLDDQPINARTIGVVERGWRWARRDPLQASLCLLVGALALISTTGSASLLSSRHQLTGALAQEQASMQNAQEQSDLARKASQLAKTHEEFAWREQKNAAERARQAQESLARAKLAAAARLDEEAKAVEAKQLAKSKGLTLAELEQAKDKAEVASKVARAERDVNAPDLLWSNYCDQLMEADTLWCSGQNSLALKKLAECRPELRGWEWHLLGKLCAGGISKTESISVSPRSKPKSTAEMRIIGLNRNGSLLAVATILHDPTRLTKDGKIARISLGEPLRKEIAEASLHKSAPSAAESGMNLTGHFEIPVESDWDPRRNAVFSPDNQWLLIDTGRHSFPATAYRLVATSKSVSESGGVLDLPSTTGIEPVVLNYASGSFVGFGPNGVLLFHPAHESKQKAFYISPQRPLADPTLSSIRSRLKAASLPRHLETDERPIGEPSEPETAPLLPFESAMKTEFSKNRKMWFFVGSLEENVYGLYCGHQILKMRGLLKVNFSGYEVTDAFVAIVNNKAVVSWRYFKRDPSTKLSGEIGCHWLYVDLLNNSVKSLLWQNRWNGAPISISPDGARLLIDTKPHSFARFTDEARFHLIDVESGRSVPKLSFLPWSGAKFGGSPLEHLVATDDWMGFTMTDKDTWHRWHIVEP